MMNLPQSKITFTHVVSIGLLLNLSTSCLKPRDDASQVMAKEESFDLKITQEEHSLLSGNSAVYAKCAESLGAMPDFTCVDGDLDDTAATLPKIVSQPISRAVEVFVGHVGDTAATNYKVLKEKSATCANPAQLSGGGTCFPGSRVGQLPSFDRKGKLMPHIKAGFICRRYREAPKKPAIGYSDIAIIQANTKTGETCFYQFLAVSQNETIPSPFKWTSLEKLKKTDTASEGKAEMLAGATFFDPSSSCVSCHDSDPFIHTRHIDSIVRGGKEVAQPIIPKHIWGLKSDYKILSGNVKSDYVFAKADATRDGRETCTACHKIGRSQTCNSLANNQWFGDFLTDHLKVPPEKLDSGMDAIQACCAAPFPAKATAAQVTSKLGKVIECERGFLPF